MTAEDTEQVVAHEQEIEEQDIKDGEHYDALRNTPTDIAGETSCGFGSLGFGA